MGARESQRLGSSSSVRSGHCLEVLGRQILASSHVHGPSIVRPSRIDETAHHAEDADRQSTYYHFSQVHSQFTGDQQRSRRRWYERMRHRSPRDDSQDVQQVVFPCAGSQSFRQGYHEVKDGVEEDRYPQDEAASRKGIRSAFLSTQFKRRTHDAIGSSAFQQTSPDYGGHGDDESHLGAGASKTLGYSFPNGLIRQFSGDFARLLFLNFPMVQEILTRRQKPTTKAAKVRARKACNLNQRIPPSTTPIPISSKINGDMGKRAGITDPMIYYLRGEV